MNIQELKVLLPADKLAKLRTYNGDGSHMTATVITPEDRLFTIYADRLPDNKQEFSIEEIIDPKEQTAKFQLSPASKSPAGVFTHSWLTTTDEKLFKQTIIRLLTKDTSVTVKSVSSKAGKLNKQQGDIIVVLKPEITKPGIVENPKPVAVKKTKTKSVEPVTPQVLAKTVEKKAPVKKKPVRKANTSREHITPEEPVIIQTRAKTARAKKPGQHTWQQTTMLDTKKERANNQ